MKIRVKFAKKGVLKFIGHLDVMRFFQKINRKAEVDIKYSAGFSPHQIMSFAAPLGLGMESEGEYVDLEVNSTGSSEAMIARLNAVVTEGLEILDWRLLPDNAKVAMSIVAGADYLLTFREGYEPENKEEFFEKLKRFMTQKEIVVEKQTKKSTAMVDIRPLIYLFEIRGEQIFMQLSTGSVSNLKPELVMSSFYASLGQEMNPFTFQILRLETYANVGTEEERKLIPLAEMGERIEG
ncbi:MAG: TIGR03936 family radical SAM-associated protein [Lachnospiraceae bacterium]